MSDIQRITLLKATIDELQVSEVVLLEGEICLVESGNNGYDSLVIGDGSTEAKSLNIIPLNVSKGSVFLGIANTETKPGTPIQDVFYMSSEAGNYKYFGEGIIVSLGELAFLRYTYGEGWEKDTILNIDIELNETSLNPVQNKIVTQKLKELEGRIIETITVNGKKLTKKNGVVDLTVDSEFSDQSENPIMNKVVSEKFKEFDWYDGN